MAKMKCVYIIGAQCTGKTTLVQALCNWIQTTMPLVSTHVVRETARAMLKQHHFSSKDVRSGGLRCLQLQQLILQSQCKTESDLELEEVDVMLGDRSGLDPLVYVRLYCGDDALDSMIKSADWVDLRTRMQEGVVIVCEPVAGWLVDDGTRLMPLDLDEWTATHEMFCTTLTDHHIEYCVLPASVLRLEDRVQFVLSHCGLSLDAH